MNTSVLFSHIRTFAAEHAVMGLVVLFVVTGYGSVFADKAKRASSKSGRPATSSYANPITDALETSLKTVHRASSRATTKPPQAKVQNGADTSRKDTRIVSVRATPDVLTVRLEMAEDEPALDLGVYNMLGKKILDVHRGAANRGSHEYTTSISDLPEGVYICIAQGNGFRRAEKFYMSR